MKPSVTTYYKDRLIIGIDPGAAGGIGVYSITQGRLIMAIKMPETPTDLLAFLKLHSLNSKCYLEKVGGIPGNGANAMFNFGRGYGHLEMALLACRIPTETVTPQKWQKEFQLGGCGKTMSKTEWKNKLKAKAQQLFPTFNVTLATCDAMLIALYGSRQ